MSVELEHRPPSVQVSDVDSGEPARDEAPDGAAPGRRRRWRPTSTAVGTAVMVAAVLALGALGGWWGWQIHESSTAEHERAVLLEAGRQAALNLTTIDYTSVDNDIHRVLDSADGEFYDEFANNAAQFAEVVRRAQSSSRGSITEAGLESVDGDTAAVLVTLTVDTRTAAGQQQEPRTWRMRISVHSAPGGVKVSNVGFVP